MANIDAPRGLSPARHISGAPYNGATNEYYVPATDSTAIYIGGLVKLAGTANADGIPTVTGNVAASDPVVGVVVSVVPVTQESTIYREASTERRLLVCDDPDILFRVQEDSVGAALAAVNTGQNASLTGFTGGDTTTGLSSIEIDSSTAAVTATLDVQLLRLDPNPKNEFGANADWLVRLNDHQFINQTTGV